MADWDSGVIRFKRNDGSIHRLFELDRGSGLLKVGDGAISSGLNLRLAENLPEINFGEWELPSPLGEDRSSGESMLQIVGWNTRSIAK